MTATLTARRPLVFLAVATLAATPTPMRPSYCVEKIETPPAG